MKHLISTAVLSAVLFFTALLQGQTPQLAVTSFDAPDPTAVQTPDGFYAVATGKTIKILHSKNLIEWTLLPNRVFQDDIPEWARERVKGTKGIWAPDIVFHKGQYYLYYSVSTWGSARSLIGLAVNKTLNPQSPDYKWEDRGIVLESHPDHTDYNAIDSAFFADDDGKAYLVWGSYWKGIKGVEVNPETGKPFKYRDGDLKIPLDYKTVANRGKGRDTSIEAPYIIKRNGYYYMFTSRGSCCEGVRSTYHIVIGRGKSPLGPYFDKDGKRMDEGGGTLLLEGNEKWKGPGHNGILQVAGDGKNAGDYVILHAYDAENAKAGRLTQVRPLYWDNDNWMEIGEILSVPFEKFDFTVR
ncbi:MAG: arabinan endo-1,5-alpha-L-arabinosidase [Planctomycetaceae bacterium]|nr:arabinan endo-1,5-alpha-L-arabinosidase [Planctomycetaceae bacterium]